MKTNNSILAVVAVVVIVGAIVYVAQNWPQSAGGIDQPIVTSDQTGDETQTPMGPQKATYQILFNGNVIELSNPAGDTKANTIAKCTAAAGDNEDGQITCIWNGQLVYTGPEPSIFLTLDSSSTGRISARDVVLSGTAKGTDAVNVELGTLSTTEEDPGETAWHREDIPVVNGTWAVHIDSGARAELGGGSYNVYVRASHAHGYASGAYSITLVAI